MLPNIVHGNDYKTVTIYTKKNGQIFVTFIDRTLKKKKKLHIFLCSINCSKLHSYKISSQFWLPVPNTIASTVLVIVLWNNWISWTTSNHLNNSKNTAIQHHKFSPMCKYLILLNISFLNKKRTHTDKHSTLSAITLLHDVSILLQEKPTIKTGLSFFRVKNN